MTDLLEALGWRARPATALGLLLTIAAVTLAGLALGTMAASLLGLSIVVVQCLVWGLWLVWLGIAFPRNRRRDEEVLCRYPYRRAFMREILFGIAVAFGQFLRPGLDVVLAGDLQAGSGIVTGAALALAVVGVAIVWLGVSTLGVARTLFVYEYVASGRRLMKTGIFRILRHPLFLGAAMVSLGLALLTGSETAIALGLVNACVVPIYVRLEDRRSCATFGPAYADYRASVGAVAPRLRSAIARSALAHQASGRIDPILPRERARRP